MFINVSLIYNFKHNLQKNKPLKDYINIIMIINIKRTIYIYIYLFYYIFRYIIILY